MELQRLRAYVLCAFARVQEADNIHVVDAIAAASWMVGQNMDNERADVEVHDLALIVLHKTYLPVLVLVVFGNSVARAEELLADSDVATVMCVYVNFRPPVYTNLQQTQNNSDFLPIFA